MRTIRILTALVAASSFAGGVVAGCANGGGDNLTLITDSGADGADTSVSKMDSGTDRTVPPSDAGKDMSNDFFVIGFDSPSSDAPGFKDTGHPGDTSFSFDAGPSFYGPPGSECPTLSLVQVEACGRCGSQTSTCILAPDGAVPIQPDTGVPETGAADATTDAGVHSDAGKKGDAGPLLVWGPFSVCTGENDAGCLPGTMTTQSCGFCGSMVTICQSDCQPGTLNCAGEVPDGCAPGSVDFVPVTSCSATTLEGTARTCNGSCMWDASTTCEPPPSTLTISPTGGGKVGTLVDFVTTQEDALLTITSCPTSASGTKNAPYGFVTLVNSSSTLNATVSVWTSQGPGAPVIDTIITSYTTMPANNTALKDCVNLVTDSCTDTNNPTPDPTSCQPNYGGLMAGDATNNAVIIPPSGSAVILVQSHLSDVGLVAVTARTESFQ